MKKNEIFLQKVRFFGIICKTHVKSYRGILTIRIVGDSLESAELDVMTGTRTLTSPISDLYSLVGIELSFTGGDAPVFTRETPARDWRVDTTQCAPNPPNPLSPSAPFGFNRLESVATVACISKDRPTTHYARVLKVS